jgi:hypothetical protein
MTGLMEWPCGKFIDRKKIKKNILKEALVDP